MDMNLKSFFQMSNLSSLTKAPLFPLEDGQTVLAQSTQRWAAILLPVKKLFIYLKDAQTVLAQATQRWAAILLSTKN